MMRKLILMRMAGGIGLFILAIGLFLGLSFISKILAPFSSLLAYLTDPPEATQQQLLAPALQEIVKTPYHELTTKYQRFIITVDGREILVTYARDGSWGNGYKIGWHGRALHMREGIVENPYTKEKDVARRVCVKIEPHHPQAKEEKFSSFEKSYAAVPNDDWYSLVPFDEYEEKEIALEAAQWEEKQEREANVRDHQRQEEDKRIRRVN